MHVYFSTTPDGSDVFANQWSSDSASSKAQFPNFVWENITYGDFKESRTVDLVLDLPDVNEFAYCCRRPLLILFRAYNTMGLSGRIYFSSRTVQVLTHLSRILTSAPSTVQGNVRHSQYPAVMRCSLSGSVDTVPAEGQGS